MKKILCIAAMMLMSVSLMAQKPAMLRLSSPSTTEQKALDWFSSNVDGDIIDVADLLSLSVDAHPVLWIMVDRVGLTVGAVNLPDGLNRLANTVLKPYVQAGGNLLLTNHATQLANAIGRCQYAPAIFGSGAGGYNADEWGIQAVIGRLSDDPESENYNLNAYDNRSHAIYQGLEENDSYGHPTFALIGDGTKLDHNCMWDLNSYADLTDNPNKVADFEDKTGSIVLGTWQHVIDYCCAGIVEFLPTEDYAGTVLACGIAAYDWTQYDYSSNFSKLTANMIDYLNTTETSVDGITEHGSASDAATYNIAGQRVSDSTKGVLVKDGKVFINR